MQENWRDIPGYEGLYQISIDGEVRCRRFYMNGKIKELSNKPNTDNRINWGLCKNGKQKTLQAAVWVAMTYPELIENSYFEGACIDHKDTNTLNSHPSNLHWVSQKENCNNPLTRKHMSETKLGVKRPDKYKAIIQYTLDGEYVNDYPSTQEAVRQNPGFNRTCISAVLSGRRKAHKGYKWKYLITK